MPPRIIPVSALFLAAFAACAAAEEPTGSVYTTIDVDDGCIVKPDDISGATLSCTGHGGYGILLREGDLRETVFFGHLGAWYADGAWESFLTFNRVNDTVEWRVRDGMPFATILRWFIEKPDPETGIQTAESRGEVLVVSKVGQPGEGEACVVGYVDAKANADANALARSIADSLAEPFTCRSDVPEYHGRRGPLAGEPSRNFGG